MVHTTVLPVSTVFLTVRITIAAALASSPDVGSSMNIIDGTSDTYKHCQYSRSESTTNIPKELEAVFINAFALHLLFAMQIYLNKRKEAIQTCFEKKLVKNLKIIELAGKNNCLQMAYPPTDMDFKNASSSGSGLILACFSRLDSSASNSYLVPTPKQRPEKSKVSLTVISPW
nr:hypothetical protein AXF42_Ash020690 [Ipomoea trifida]